VLRIRIGFYLNPDPGSAPVSIWIRIQGTSHNADRDPGNKSMKKKKIKSKYLTHEIVMILSTEVINHKKFSTSTGTGTIKEI